jgi:catechol 2,3-dioxygenase-like lactoylglutathione lyase family enzyme
MSKIVLWVSDLAAQTEFYRALFNGTVSNASAEFAEVSGSGSGNSVLLHLLPEEYRYETPLTAQLPKQSEVAIKPVFKTYDLTAAKQRTAHTLASFAEGSATYGAFTYQDVVDPEGNVIQLQQSAKTKGLFDDELFAITLVAHDLAASIDFYGAKLSAKQVFSDDVSAVFVCGKTMINLLSGAAAVDLVEPASVVSEGQGVSAVYTLRVADVDATAAQLEAAGVRLLNGPIDRPWGVRTASFQDPSGHTWELADHA